MCFFAGGTRFQEQGFGASTFITFAEIPFSDFFLTKWHTFSSINLFLVCPYLLYCPDRLNVSVWLRLLARPCSALSGLLGWLALTPVFLASILHTPVNNTCYDTGASQINSSLLTLSVIAVLLPGTFTDPSLSSSSFVAHTSNSNCQALFSWLFNQMPRIQTKIHWLMDKRVKTSRSFATG